MATDSQAQGFYWGGEDARFRARLAGARQAEGAIVRKAVDAPSHDGCRELNNEQCLGEHGQDHSGPIDAAKGSSGSLAECVAHAKSRIPRKQPEAYCQALLDGLGAAGVA